MKVCCIVRSTALMAVLTGAPTGSAAQTAQQTFTLQPSSGDSTTPSDGERLTLGGAEGAPPIFAGLGYQLHVRRYATGNSTPGVNLNLINVEGDSAQIGNNNFLNYFTVQGTMNSKTITGGRQAVQASVTQTSPTARDNTTRAYVGGNFGVVTYSGDNGRGLSKLTDNTGAVGPGEASGAYYGLNPVAILAGTQFTGNLKAGSTTISNIPPVAFGTLKVGNFVRGLGASPSTIPETSYITALDPAGRSITTSLAPTQTSVGGTLGASSAQYVANVSGMEVNLAAQAGSSVFYKSGIQIAPLPSDQESGSSVDALISISGQGGVGWRDGILFGAQNGSFPVSAKGYLLRSSGPGVATVAITALGVIQTSNLAGLGHRPIFSDQDGSLTNVPMAAPFSSSSTCSVGQFASDTKYVYFCVATNKWKRAALLDW